MIEDFILQALRNVDKDVDSKIILASPIDSMNISIKMRMLLEHQGLIYSLLPHFSLQALRYIDGDDDSNAI